MSSLGDLTTVEKMNLQGSISYFFKFLRIVLPGVIGAFISIMSHTTCYGQQATNNLDTSHVSQGIDIFDVIRKWAKKPAKNVTDTADQHAKNLSFLPILGYGPANGVILGAAVSVTKFLGNPKTTQLSAALMNASITTNSQLILNLRFDVYTPNNKWYISGDNRLYFFTQPTYGLGINGLYNQSYGFSFNGYSQSGNLAQPLDFDYLRLYETFLRNVGKHWYLGLGVKIDRHFNIRDPTLKLDSPTHLTSHYVYSKAYGFDTAKYSASGISFDIMHDTRDNPVNAYKGYYLNVSFRVNPAFVGSSKSSVVVYYEYRAYINVNKDIPRNLIAFWFWGTDVISGHLPYLALPALTWDTYNRSGRGYIQGRFRGDNMIYGESEFRFRLTKNDLLGGVAFVNATTASNPLPYAKQSVFNSVAPGYGAGIRIKMNKADRTNIAADYAKGYGFSGIYLNIRETF